MAGPFESPWAPSVAVIDYLVTHLGLAVGLSDAVKERQEAAAPVKAAADAMKDPTPQESEALDAATEKVTEKVECIRARAQAVLLDRLRDGSVKARGPIVDADDTDIPREFWRRFVAISPDGAAVDLSKLRKLLPWFDVSARDVVGSGRPLWTRSRPRWNRMLSLRGR